MPKHNNMYNVLILKTSRISFWQNVLPFFENHLVFAEIFLELLWPSLHQAETIFM